MFTERLGVPVQDCVLVDDTQRNIETAQSIGMQTVLIDEQNNTLKHYLSTQVSLGHIKKQSNAHDK